MIGPKTRPLSHPDDEPYGATVVELALAAMRNLYTVRALAAPIDSPVPLLPSCRSKALLDSAGLPVGQSGNPCREPPPRKRHR